MNTPKIPFSISFFTNLTESFRIFVVGSIISIYGLILYEIFPEIIFNPNTAISLFVVPMAALAFVVLNMGFATSQKAKTSIVATLAEAGSSLQIQGKVFGYATGEIEALGIPIKIASGGDSVNLAEGFVSVKFTGPGVTYDDIYEGVLRPANEYNSLNATGPNAELDFAGAGGGPRLCDDNPLDTVPVPALSQTCAYIYFTVNDNNNEILDAGEHAVLAVWFTTGTDAPDALDKIKIELIPSSGAALTVERNVPNLSTTFVDLG